ncbi:MAG: hypothetical protein WCC57_20315 [Paracoccaceae bacterium]
MHALEASPTDRVSISPDAAGDDFAVVAFSLDRLGDGGAGLRQTAPVSAAAARTRGTECLSVEAWPVLVVDIGAAPALRVIAEMLHAAPEARRACFRNHRARITKAPLRGLGGFNDLTSAAQEETVDVATGPVFAEAEEYSCFSDRLIGVEVDRGNPTAASRVEQARGAKLWHQSCAVVLTA